MSCLVASILTLAGPLPGGRPRLVGVVSRQFQKFERALVRVIQARRQGAVAADERVLLHFQDGCPALVASILTLAGPLQGGRPRLVGVGLRQFQV